jgi:cation diffusion facilitator CzcD-associated flavoprotein CzcO
MGSDEQGHDDELLASVEGWLASFGDALSSGDAAAVVDLLDDHCAWRDIICLTWDIRTFDGHAAIWDGLGERLKETRLSDLRLRSDPAPRWVVRGGRRSIEALVDLRAPTGRGQGVVRLVPGSSGLRAIAVLTALAELDGHGEAVGEHRPAGRRYLRSFGGPNWEDDRRTAAAFEDREPEVLVVGAGQSGLAVAARLGQLGVDTLVVDRAGRVGDNWRHRYHSLTLHNQVWVNHLPYQPFPETWPTYIPKDKLADWLESYARNMELNVWTGTALTGATFDDTTRTWTATLDRSGSERVVRPRHVVIATGVSGIPNIPHIDGIDDFRGPVLHSTQYTDGSGFAGRRVVVFGTGNSGHDVAQDLHHFGAEVTMVQRSPTTIVQVEPSAQRVYALYSEGLRTDDCDLIFSSIAYPVLFETYRELTQRVTTDDRPLLEGLAAAGFRTDIGHDGTGFQMKYMRRGGGYYINVGCSDLIVEGKVRVVQDDDLARVGPAGLEMRDGSSRDADAIVLATGYHGHEAFLRRHFGDEVADRVGPIWGFDDLGELRNIWKPTAQRGLWFHAGSLAQNRIFSRYLAIQIKADLEGIAEDQVRSA